MYTVTITDKKILEQHETVLLTVEFKSDTPLPDPVIDPNKEVKLNKKGEPKKKKNKKPKYPTKTIYFKFPITTPFEDMKAEIKKRKEAIEALEDTDIPVGVPLTFD